MRGSVKSGTEAALAYGSSALAYGSSALADKKAFFEENACYWICAYANNQWELSDSLSDDPFQTSFNKALSMVRGTVTIIDGGGVVYSRIWCAFEAYVTITTGRPDYKWDVYTTHVDRCRVTTGVTFRASAMAWIPVRSATNFVCSSPSLS